MQGAGRFNINYLLTKQFAIITSYIADLLCLIEIFSSPLLKQDH